MAKQKSLRSQLFDAAKKWGLPVRANQTNDELIEAIEMKKATAKAPSRTATKVKTKAKKAPAEETKVEAPVEAPKTKTKKEGRYRALMSLPGLCEVGDTVDLNEEQAERLTKAQAVEPA